MDLPTDLTDPELLALRAVRHGADVRSYALAKCLRALRRRHPDLVTLTEPMGEYGPRDEHPYLGAIVERPEVSAAVEDELARRAGSGDE